MGEKDISSWEKIAVARKLLIDEFSDHILELKLNERRPLLTIKFTKGFTVYIRYNDYGEYSYQIQFSQQPQDFIRYDNFDDRWNVSSRPHHLHPRNTIKATKSPMVGSPEKDIPFLIKAINSLLK